jgi:methyl-accepting chemotaxis protein
VGEGVKLVGETGEALRRIVERVSEIDALVSEIAASSQEQATGLNEVNTAVNQMDQVTQQNAAMVEQSTAATHSLKSETAELARLLEQFTITAQGLRQAVATRPVAVSRTATGVHAPKPEVLAARQRLNAFLTPPTRGATALKAESDGWEEF